MQASPMVLTTLAGLSTALGGLLAVAAKPTKTTLSVSAGFAGGVMRTASLADLLPEALRFYSSYLPSLTGGAAIVMLLALGMFTAGLLGRLLPEETELAQKYGQNTARTQAMRTALITGAALLLHNFPEGVLTLFAGTADPALGLRTALAIALHNIPEGLAVAVPFAYATNSRAKGVLAALVSGLAEPAGALLALVLLRGLFTPGFLNGTVVLVAGIMIWVALAQLLPAALAPPRRLPGVLGGEYVNHPVAIVWIFLPILGIYVDFLKQSAEANIRNPAAGFFQNFPAQAVLRRLPGALSAPGKVVIEAASVRPGAFVQKHAPFPENQRLAADANDHARFSIRSIFSAHFSMVSASKAG